MSRLDWSSALGVAAVVVIVSFSTASVAQDPCYQTIDYGTMIGVYRPEIDPKYPWSIWEEQTHDVAWYLWPPFPDDNVVVISSYDEQLGWLPGGSALFYRVIDKSLCTAARLEVEAEVVVFGCNEATVSGTPHAFIGISDGEKYAVLWPGGDPSLGRVAINFSNVYYSADGVTDWALVTKYRLVMDKTDPADRFVEIYVDDVSVLREQYDNLQDSADFPFEQIESSQVVTFGAMESVSFFRHLVYEVTEARDSDDDCYVDIDCPYGDDCDDGNPDINPGAVEICDGLDNDCDGLTDEGALCDDGNPCTDDACDPVMGCVHTPNTAPCDDGDACTTNDVCSGGSCVGGPFLDCDDGNICMDAFCDSPIGCVYTPNTAPCDDGNACTTGDTCSEGVCLGERPVLAAHYYDCSTVPEVYPPGAWEIHRQDPDVTWYSDTENLHIDAYESGGSLEFYRTEPSLAVASGYRIVANTHISPTRHRPPHGLQFTYASFGAVDGEKSLVVWTGGDPLGGEVYVPTMDGGYYSAGGVDWFAPTAYEAVVERVPLDPALSTLKLYHGPDLVLTVPYEELLPASPDYPPHIFGIGGVDSDTVWGYVSYAVLEEPHCDDDNPCTDDFCDPASGCVSTQVPDGTPCDDGDHCTMDDICTDGVCDGVLLDEDGDGFVSDDCLGGKDCDDDDPGVYPGAEEVCDGKDNNCNGEIDEGFGTTTCGQGVCHHTVQNCLNGQLQTCDPFEGASEEVCDLKDNDCDGYTDEELGTTTCGLGVCENTVQNCVHGVTQICIPLDVATDEECDLLDNDCDGQTDEELGSTTCGLGECLHTVQNCVNGQEQTCDPLEGASRELCDFLDNDCDGYTDEDLTRTNILGCIATGALGECRHGNTEICRNGTWVCQPGEPRPEGHDCDALDNDCDGLTDEENPLCEQPPACDPICDDVPEVCRPSSEICDDKDNDCDGRTDEGIEGVGEPCTTYSHPPVGPGYPPGDISKCFGYWECVGGETECVVPEGVPEICNGRDDNCDGVVDEGCYAEPSSSGGWQSGSSWEPSDCAFLTDLEELVSCFNCMEPLPPYPGTDSCAEDLYGCIGGFCDDQGRPLGPFPVPAEYPGGTFMQTYKFNDDDTTSLIYKITIVAQEDWVSQFPLAFDFVAYENDELFDNPDFGQGVLLSQARVERRLVDVPVPEGFPEMSFYFVPQIETRNLAIAIHGLRYYQDPDPSDGDDSGCFTALADVIFEGAVLDHQCTTFDWDGDGLADGFETSEGMDPTSPAVCDLEGLVYRSGIENRGIENSLAKKACNACEKHDQGNKTAARNQLNAFVNEVEAQRGVHVSEAIADILITYASAAIQALE